MYLLLTRHAHYRSTVGSAPSHPQMEAERCPLFLRGKRGWGEPHRDFSSLHLHFTGQRSLHGYANLKQGQRNMPYHTPQMMSPEHLETVPMTAIGTVKRKSGIMDLELSKAQVQILVLRLIRCLITCKPIKRSL